ncbi:MAG: hypothetical protein ACHQKY_10065 [Terriglobia bacterium]
MKQSTCEFEELVLQALRTDHWDSTIADHVHQCEVCSDLLEVAGGMRQLGELPVVDSRLPDPRQIWYKAQLLERQAVQEQVVRPIRIFRNASYFVLLLVMLQLLMRHWPKVRSWLSVLRPEWERTVTAFNLTPLFMGFLLMSVGLVCLSVIFTFFAVLSEE